MLKLIEIIHDPFKRNSVQGVELVLNGFQISDLFPQLLSDMEGFHVHRVLIVQKGGPGGEKGHPGTDPPRVFLKKTGRLRTDEIQIGTRRSGRSRSVGQLPVDLPDDGGIKGVVNRWGTLSLAAVSGNFGHALLIEGPFEEDGFSSLDQSGSGFSGSCKAKNGPFRRGTSACRFSPPSRPSSTVFLSSGTSSCTSHYHLTSA